VLRSAKMAVSKTSKMLNYVNYRMRVTLTDTRQIVGRFMAFDRHMNLVLSDAEEFRQAPPKKVCTYQEDRAVPSVAPPHVRQRLILGLFSGPSTPAGYVVAWSKCWRATSSRRGFEEGLLVTRSPSQTQLLIKRDRAPVQLQASPRTHPP
jgi:small nuclear ribonucleoprotein (snRNP)-like protein